MPSGIYVRTKEHNRHIQLALTGKKHTEERRRNNSLGLLNMSEEAKAKRSKKLSLTHKGKLPWNTGKKFTEQQRKNVCLGLRNRSPEAKADQIRKYQLARQNRSVEAKAETSRKIHLSRLNRVYPFKDTKIEVALQNVLKQNNVPFKTHVPLLGQPDLFIEPNICIFADGDYWHANPDKYKEDFVMFKCKLAKDIWKKDKKITETLISKGYKVLRFWEKDIKSDIRGCLDKIKMVIYGV